MMAHMGSEPASDRHGTDEGEHDGDEEGDAGEEEDEGDETQDKEEDLWDFWLTSCDGTDDKGDVCEGEDLEGTKTVSEGASSS